MQQKSVHVDEPVWANICLYRCLYRQNSAPCGSDLIHFCFSIKSNLPCADVCLLMWKTAQMNVRLSMLKNVVDILHHVDVSRTLLHRLWHIICCVLNFVCADNCAAKVYAAWTNRFEQTFIYTYVCVDKIMCSVDRILFIFALQFSAPGVATRGTCDVNQMTRCREFPTCIKHCPLSM